MCLCALARVVQRRKETRIGVVDRPSNLIESLQIHTICDFRVLGFSV